MKKIIVVLLAVMVIGLTTTAGAGDSSKKSEITYAQAAAAGMRIFPTGEKVIRNMDMEGRLDNVEIFFPENPAYGQGCIIAELNTRGKDLHANESIARVGIANIEKENQTHEWGMDYLFNRQTIVPMEQVMRYLENLDPNTCSWDDQGRGGTKHWCVY